MTLEGFQAEQAIQVWIERMKAFRDDTDRRESCALRNQSANDLVAELIHAASRTGLAARIAEELARLNHGLTVERVAPPAAILAAEAINGFVASLGMASVPEAARPRVTVEDGPARPVFAARPGRDSVADLPDTPRSTARDLWEDWVFALDAVMQDNARDGGGVGIDIEENLRLGRILDGIRSEGRA